MISVMKVKVEGKCGGCWNKQTEKITIITFGANQFRFCDKCLSVLLEKLNFLDNEPIDL